MLRKRRNECGDRRPVFGHGAYICWWCDDSWMVRRAVCLFLPPPHRTRTNQNQNQNQRTNRIESNRILFNLSSGRINSNQMKSGILSVGRRCVAHENDQSKEVASLTDYRTKCRNAQPSDPPSSHPDPSFWSRSRTHTQPSS